MAEMFEVETVDVSPGWRDSLDDAGLLDIESLSTREFDWVERPNQRLGGWSGVSRLRLSDQQGESVPVFLKIQVNHCYRTIGNLMRKRLTYEREMDAFKALQDTSLLPELILFAKWRNGRDVGSVVITRALDGYVVIKDLLKGILEQSGDPDQEIRRALASIAAAMRTLHATGWAHFALKPKHVFLRPVSGSDYSVRFIDFERARRPIREKIFVTEDVSRFLRHCFYLTREQKLQCLRDYFQVEAFSARQQRLVKELEKSKSLNQGRGI